MVYSTIITLCWKLWNGGWVGGWLGRGGVGGQWDREWREQSIGSERKRKEDRCTKWKGKKEGRKDNKGIRP